MDIWGGKKRNGYTLWLFYSYSKEERKKIKVEYLRNTEDYKILRLTNVEDKREEYFLYTKKSRNIFKIDNNYPVFI